MAEKIPKKEKDENLPAGEQRKSEKPLSKYQQKQMSVMKETMGGAPEVVSTIRANQNTDLEIPQEVAVKDEPWLRPGVIESALMPRIVPPADQAPVTPIASSGDEDKNSEAAKVAAEGKTPTMEELLDKRVRRIFQYRKMGIGYDEITKNLEEIAEDPLIIAEALKQVKGREISRQWEAKNQLREELNEERTLSQAERKETADLRASLGQVETKPGLATEWQKDIAPPAKREKPLAVPADTRQPIQVETKSLDATPVDEYMELIQNFMNKDQPIPPEVQAVYEDIQKSIASKDDVAKDAALEKLRGFVTKQQEVVHAETDTHIPVAHGESESAVIPVGDLKKERVFDEKGAEYVDFKETVIDKEGTPKEWREKWREKLRGLIDGAKEKLGMSELGEKMKGFLSKRSGELDVEAGKMGKGEKLFRTMGEKYNKLPMWQKVALGGSLAVGYGFTLPISSWLAGAYALPLFATRVAAMAGSFENNRKQFETINKGEAKGLLANTGLYKWLGSGSEKNRENKAMAKALIQSFGMTLGLSYAAHEIAEHHVAERIGQWMTEHMPSKAPEAPAAPHMTGGKIAGMPGTMQPAAAEVAGGEVVASSISPEIPGIEVTATPGHGYEYMMKRLWEQLQEKNIKLPSGANPDSDLAQLLRADEKTIDGVVHRLAQDNEFFKGDGTSARINLDSKLTIDTNGQIWLDHENILAPEDAPVTPAYHAEVPAPEVAPSEIENGVGVTPEHTAATEIGSEQTVPTAEGQESQVPVTEQENSAQTPDAVGEVIKNKFDLSIPTAEPHIYANEAKSLFVYGGNTEQKTKMIMEYLNNNPDRVLYAEDANHNRVPWLRELGGQGKIIQGPVMRTSGLASIFSPFMKAPSPDDLKELVT